MLVTPGTREGFTKEKQASPPTGLLWDTNMAAVLLIRDTNKWGMTSCENALYKVYWPLKTLSDTPNCNNVVIEKSKKQKAKSQLGIN